MFDCGVWLMCYSGSAQARSDLGVAGKDQTMGAQSDCSGIGQKDMLGGYPIKPSSHDQAQANLTARDWHTDYLTKCAELESANAINRKLVSGFEDLKNLTDKLRVHLRDLERCLRERPW
jgi:hypothetical protein